MKKLISLVVVTILFFGGIPINHSMANIESSATIAIDSLNVREGPGLSFRVVKQVKKGESFRILKEENEWIQIRLNQNQTGWVANWLVSKEKNSAIISSGNQFTSGLISVDGLRVRNGPGLSFQTIGHLNSGNQVQVKERNENWVKISFASLEGWVSSEFVSTQTSNGQANQNTSERSTDILYIATVTVDSLNVRSDASTQANVLGKLRKGDSIEVLASTKDWVQFKFLGKNAWISSQYITKSNQSNPPTTQTNHASSSSTKGIIGTVTANALNIRSLADLSSKVVGQVVKGSQFVILEEVNNWSKIEYAPKQYGWVNSWYLEKNVPTTVTPQSQTIRDSQVTIIHNGTNIRSGPNVSSPVVRRGNEGEKYTIKSLNGEWYEITLENGSSAYIAGWIVSVNGSAPKIEKAGAEAHLKNKTIVLDPGHGGGDSGTTGARGTLEKELTLRTASLLYDKLRASGANVILTRTNDSYLSLRSRVSTANYHQADAFLSIHYDSILDRSVRGMTTYYYHNHQRKLAENVHTSTISQTKLKDRGTRFGDYHVVRESNQKAILIELGYLSNPAEEAVVTTPQYQEAAATGMYNGLARFFKANDEQ